MPDSPLTQRDVEALRVTLDKLDRTVEGLPLRIEETYVRKDVYRRDLELLANQLGDVKGDVAKHGDWLQWATRIVIGLVIVGLVSLLFVSSMGPGAAR